MGNRDHRRTRNLFREVYEHIDDGSPQAPEWSAVRDGNVSFDRHRSVPLIGLMVAVGVLIIAAVGFVGWPRSETSISPGNAAADVTGSEIAVGSMTTTLSGAGPTTTTVPLDFGSCPVTIPTQPGFQPTDGHPLEPPFGVWYGTEGLWTVLESDGSYRPRKAVFWSAKFLGGIREGQPEVFVTWRRLDGSGEVIDNGGYATNAKDQSGDFMIAGFDPNRPGCWEVTATYKGATLVYTYLVPGEPDTPDPTTTTPPIVVDPIFGDELPWVLLFDDGIDGVLAVDPVNRIAARSVIYGQRAGDQPRRLEIIASHLIIGWGEIYARSLADGLTPLLGEATIYLPAAKQDRVWLIDYPYGRVGVGVPTVWQVSTSMGQLISEPVALEVKGIPAIGIPGGLAVETDDGIALWDASSGEVTEVLGRGPSYVGDVSRDLDARIVWCEDRCVELHITRLGSGEDAIVTARAGETFDVRSARFANDLRFLAVPTASRIVVIDLENLAASTDFSAPGSAPFAFVAWSPSGTDLFASTYSYGGSSTSVAWHDALRGTTSYAELPFGGTLSFVVINKNQASAFLGEGLQSPVDCPATIVQPSSRTEVCSFGF